MKKRIFILSVGFLWLLIGPSGLFAQDPWIPGPFSQGALPFEQIVLTTDRDLYLAGETIWFTADYMTINNSTEGQVSHVLYIEVFNSEKEVIIREKFSIRNGNASGCLVIPEETATDEYLLRAYTQFQRNFPAESYTMKSLTIVNPDIPYLYKSLKSSQIAIVPEGGEFVRGLPNRAAIRLDPQLARQAQRVSLVDQHQRMVAQVRFFSNGLGACDFMPVDTLDYRLMVILENGDTLVEWLPASESWKDYLPSVKKTDNILIYSLEGRMPWVGDSVRSLMLSLQSVEGITLDEVDIKDEKLPVRIQIPFPATYRGILYMVLKEPAGDILHVLPVFLPGVSCEEIRIESDKAKYLCREPVALRLGSPGRSDKPLDLSVSVIKKGMGDARDSLLPQNYIRNPFLLHSYALTQWAITPSLTEQADLSMILYTPYVNTFLFQSQLAKVEAEGIVFLPDIRDVSISGQVVWSGSGDGMKGVPVILSVLEQSQIHMMRSDAQGRFGFSLDNLEGKQDLVLCPRPEEGQNAEILINQDFSGQFPEQLFLLPAIDSTLYDVIEQAWINAQVMRWNAPVRITPGPASIPEILFAEDRQVVVLSDYIEMKSLYEVFWEIVPFVQIRKKKDHFYAQLTNDRMEVFEDPMILLDNVPVKSVDDLLKIPPALVDRIESINHPYLHGDFIMNGVVMVYTKTDNFAGSPFPKGSVFLDYLTITPSCSFPEYDYLTEECKASRLPDFRNTLYWEPGLILTGEEKQFSFYTSDHYGEYEVVVRGTSEGGLSYYGKARIQVTERNK
jgi:hypothetical protein